MAVRIGINGACGRMGQRVLHAMNGDSDVEIGAAIENASHPQRGNDIGGIAGLGACGVAVSEVIPDRLDVVIDFSIPAGSVAIAHHCVERSIPLVVATTGHTTQERQELEAAKTQIPILIAANLSLVVNLLMKLSREAARALRGKDFDVEIVEQHHRFKADSPSGTALRFAEILEETMGLTRRVYGREGLVGERPRDELGLHAIRGGDNVGQHTIIFSAIGETLELVHKSTSRDSYAKGAVAAAKFLVGKPAGRYEMADVLGL